MSVAPTLLEVRNLKKHFPIKKGLFNRQVGSVKAVDGISFEVNANETVGLVGESGCGKTTAGRSLLRLLEPTDGEVLYKGQDILKMGPAEMRSLRRNLQIIFQDPFSSLNPRMTIESIIGEAITFHKVAQGPEVREMVEGLLERVGLQPSYITRYPHEFSGGQRQRVGIARALALNPDFIVCDEAVSALDVSVQAQVINLLMDLQQEFNLSYLFIAHDLSVVQHISDRIAVMYLGQIAEFAECDELYDNPLHPYTQALLSAIPQPNPRRRAQRIILKGDVPSPMNPPSGCRFHTRCPACFAPCKTVEPRTVEPTPGHKVRCHLYDPEFAPNDPDIWARLPRQPEAPVTVTGDEGDAPAKRDASSDAAPDGTDGVASSEAAETAEPAATSTVEDAGAESSDVSSDDATAESSEAESPAKSNA